MDLNTILLIAFAAMMLFCCGGLGKLFRRGDDRNSLPTVKGAANADVAATAKKAKHSRSG